MWRWGSCSMECRERGLSLFPLLLLWGKLCFLGRTMSDLDSISELQSQLAHLKRHISEQDAEFYQLAKRVDALSKLVQQQKAQMSALSSGGVAAAEDMPANEKPPHY